MNVIGVVGIFFLVLAGTRFSAPRPAPTDTTGGVAASSSASTSASADPSQLVSGFDPRAATYAIEGRNVTLANGVSEQAIPNSSSRIVTRYFGNGAIGDINGDGRNDIAYYVTQEPGGTGVFYYVVAAINMGTSSNPIGADGTIVGTYKVLNAVLVGDRIAPLPTEIKDGLVYAQYADRKLGEPMTASPSVGMTKMLDINAQGMLAGV